MQYSIEYQISSFFVVSSLLYYHSLCHLTTHYIYFCPTIFQLRSLCFCASILIQNTSAFKPIQHYAPLFVYFLGQELTAPFVDPFIAFSFFITSFNVCLSFIIPCKHAPQVHKPFYLFNFLFINYNYASCTTGISPKPIALVLFEVTPIPFLSNNVIVLDHRRIMIDF